MLIWIWPLYPLAPCSSAEYRNRQTDDSAARAGYEYSFPVVRNIPGQRATGYEIRRDYDSPRPRRGTLLTPDRKETKTWRFYVPTRDELATVQSCFPDADPGDAPWLRIQADLIAHGCDAEKLVAMCAPTLVRLLAGDCADGTAEMPIPKPKKSKRRGRKPDTDAEQDARLYQAWQTGEHKTKADLDRVEHLPTGTSKLACDRHRKRLSKGK